MSMRKIICFCEFCGKEADWRMRPGLGTYGWYDLIVFCHGEEDHYRISSMSLADDGKILPLQILAFDNLYQGHVITKGSDIPQC